MKPTKAQIEKASKIAKKGMRELHQREINAIIKSNDAQNFKPLHEQPGREKVQSIDDVKGKKK